MTSHDLLVIGAGPAGLAASIEAAKRGCSVALVDRYPKAGGQLIKQIHKFFGSREHRAGRRGLDIAADLLLEISSLGIELLLGWEVYAIEPGGLVGLVPACSGAIPGDAGKETSRMIRSLSARKIILATGAEENSLCFDGWTLPGVMGAGAAQTMINVWRVLPGRQVLVIGSGNVGLIVTYHLLQAGANVSAIIEAAPRIGGYGVHSAKVRRAGIPILTSHTIVQALGRDSVEGAVVAEVNRSWKRVEGTERVFTVDTICIAVGLRPNTRLAALAGCRLSFSKSLGGWVPIHNAQLRTTVPGIYVAGDASGVEEASTALEEGRLAGIIACADVHKSSESDSEEIELIRGRLFSLRCGPFGESARKAKEALIQLGEKECVNQA